MEEIPFLRKYAAARKAFESGTIWTDDDEKLKEYIEGIATNKNINQAIRHTDIIKAVAINHIQTKKLIENINKRNESTTRWFMILAIGSLLIGSAGLLWQINKDIQLVQIPALSHKEELVSGEQSHAHVKVMEASKDESIASQKDLNK